MILKLETNDTKNRKQMIPLLKRNDTEIENK
jgi:hypothetical protein